MLVLPYGAPLPPLDTTFLYLVLPLPRLIWSSSTAALGSDLHSGVVQPRAAKEHAANSRLGCSRQT